MPFRFNALLKSLCVTAVSLLISAGAVHPEIHDVQSVLDRMETTYAGRSFSADFHQISTLEALDVTETASGRVYFSHPGKMRWTYNVPTPQEVISDGTFLWIYRPDQNQVLKGDARAFFNSGAGGAFLSDISKVREQYTAAIESTGGPHIQLRLTPKVPSPEIQSILVNIDKSNDHITQVTTYNPYGDATTLRFWNILFSELDPSRFTFSPPEGTDVIEMQ